MKIIIYLLLITISCTIGYLVGVHHTQHSISIKQLYSKDDIEFILKTESYIPDSGFVSNAVIAADIAKVVISSIYNEKYSNGYYFNINSIGDSLWLIVGNHKNEENITLGGNPYILIKKNGEIIKVVHTK